MMGMLLQFLYVLFGVLISVVLVQAQDQSGLGLMKRKSLYIVVMRLAFQYFRCAHIFLLKQQE